MKFFSDKQCGSCGKFIARIEVPPGSPGIIIGCCDECNTAVFRKGEVESKQLAEVQQRTQDDDKRVNDDAAKSIADANQRAEMAESNLSVAEKEIERLKRELEESKNPAPNSVKSDTEESAGEPPVAPV